jgi:hypothetical protein
VTRLSKVTLASLVEDFTLYPRGTVNANHVRDLRRALEADNTLPPIVAEADTLRIVDGFHRRRAYIAHLGADAAVRVELRQYESDRELYRDAARLNAAHGQPLDRHDQVRVAVRLRELGSDDTEIAATLHVTTERVEALLLNLTAKTHDGELVALKSSVRHLAGRTLTDQQEQAHPRITGTATLRLVGDLRDRLRHSLMDLDSEQVRAGLDALSREIREALERFKAPVG